MRIPCRGALHRAGLGLEFFDAVDAAIDQIGDLPGSGSLVPRVPAEFPVRRIAVKLSAETPMNLDADLLETDPVTGKQTALASEARRALRALRLAKVPHAVVGAAALAARGLPRMTKDLDIVVRTEDAWAALDALQSVGFRTASPVNRKEEPEAMYVLLGRRGGEVDLLVAAGEPEVTVVEEATCTTLFGTAAPVASLEHLLLMYLYSNQPRHLGDFARIVTETNVDLAKVMRFLQDVHPEMVPELEKRLSAVRQPPPPPPRPKRH
jgi:hypothetical protein